MLEKEIQNKIQLQLSNGCNRLWRINVGNFETKDGRYISIGTTGMSDLIGFASIEVSQEMVGTKVALIVAMEIKSARGRATPEQIAFLELVRRAGGRAGIARSVDDARAIITG